MSTKPKSMADVHKVKLSEEKISSDNKQERHEDNKPRIDMSRVRIKSKLNVKDKSFIRTIVPLQNNTTWVQAGTDCYLTLIDSTGKIITTSESLGEEIYHAKQYRNGLLVTCQYQCKIYNLSTDGKSTSTFCDLSPYNTRGFCVTQDMDIMVCLQSRTDHKDNKVVRLNTAGDIIQTLQHDVTGTLLYSDPREIIALTTGEVIVIDGHKILGVDREGKHMFTWEGEIQGRKLDQYSLECITHDNNNNLIVTDNFHRVLVLEKDGSGAMCLLDSMLGIDSPCGIALDNKGQLWVGCSEGNILIIEY